MKKYLMNPPTLVAPLPGEVLQLYISATSGVVSTALVVEREEDGSTRRVQHPVYFISEVLNESKIRYFHILKLAYALKITVKTVVHYVQAHTVEVHTSSTLGEIMRSREATGKIAKWAIELSMYDIVFKPRTTIKAQALSDFVMEWTEAQRPEEATTSD